MFERLLEERVHVLRGWFMRRVMAKHQGRSLDPVALAATLTELGGLDRYESLRWSVRERDGMHGLFITAFPKPYAPPFLFLGLSLENTTANEFRFGLNARYLTFDKVSSGSELRIDGALGSDPALGIALYKLYLPKTSYRLAPLKSPTVSDSLGERCCPY